MQLFRIALKEAAWAFLFSRLTIVLVSYIGIILIPQFGIGRPLDCAQGDAPGMLLLSETVERLSTPNCAATSDVEQHKPLPNLIFTVLGDTADPSSRG